MTWGKMTVMSVTKKPTGPTVGDKPKRTSAPGRGSKPGERRGGRAPGTPNKVTQEFRDTVRQLLEGNAGNVGTWLHWTALGVGRGHRVETGADGKPVVVPFEVRGAGAVITAQHIAQGQVPADVHIAWLIEPDPDKALQRLCGLAEYAAPKLARTEIVGDPNAPLQVSATAMVQMDPQTATDEYRKALGK